MSVKSIKGITPSAKPAGSVYVAVHSESELAPETVAAFEKL